MTARYRRPFIKITSMDATLSQLAEAGLNDFYLGDIAHKLASDLSGRFAYYLADFHQYQAKQVTPLSVGISHGTLFNTCAYTNGLLILACTTEYSSKPVRKRYVHLLIECANKLSLFAMRLLLIQTEFSTKAAIYRIICPAKLDTLAAKINLNQALPWP